MGQYDDARRSIESSRARMSAIADELSRRTSSDYIGGRAKEVARMRADGARRNPRLLGTLGALAGGAIGMALAKSQQRHRRESYRSYEAYPYGENYGDYGYGAQGFRTRSSWVSRERTPAPSWDAYPYGGREYAGPDYVAAPEVSRYEGWDEELRGQEQGGGVSEKAQEFKERAAGAAEGLKGRAEEFKEKVSHKAGELKSRASEHEGPSLKEKVAHKATDFKEMATERSGAMREKGFAARDKMKSRASAFREHMPSGHQVMDQSHQHPLAMLFGAFLIGAAAAALLPLSIREKRMMHPAHQKASSELGTRWRSFEERFESAIGGGDTYGRESEGQGGTGYEQRSGGEGYGQGSFTSRDAGGISHSEEAEEPYRQPDFAEVAEEAQKDDIIH